MYHPLQLSNLSTNFDMTITDWRDYIDQAGECAPAIEHIQNSFHLGQQKNHESLHEWMTYNTMFCLMIAIRLHQP